MLASVRAPHASVRDASGTDIDREMGMRVNRNPAAAMAAVWPEEGNDSLQAPCGRGTQQGLRLLLVDDCRAHRLMVAAMLARWDIVPTMACNGAQAVILAERTGFDIVLMDLLMPVMGGLAATAEMRQAERQKGVWGQRPIVACTSLDPATDPGWTARVGFSAVLRKPCTAMELQKCLARWCPDKFLVSQRQRQRQHPRDSIGSGFSVALSNWRQLAKSDAYARR